MTTKKARYFAVLGSAVVLSLVVLCVGEAKPQSPKYLVIHSDDSGFSAAVNEATIRAMERGVVSSSNIMVMCPGFDEIAKYAVANPDRDFGLHLVLTAEKWDFRWGPVLKGQVPSLVQTDGSFWRTSAEVAQHAKIDDVDRELRAQIQKALDRKIRITHLDHHMWVMLQRPDLLKVYVQLGLDFKLPIRLHRHLTPAECGKLLQNPDEYRTLIQPAVAQGNPLFDFIETDNYGVPPAQKRAYYLKALRGLKPGISEFVIHCSVNRAGTLRWTPKTGPGNKVEFRT
ncbi:MAG: polysaccharide deacetylase family protein [Planctomycetota bacterium]